MAAINQTKKQQNSERVIGLSQAHMHGRKVYICPKCKRKVPYKSRQCPFCGEKYPFAVKVPASLLKNVCNGIATKILHDYVHAYVFPNLTVSDQKYLHQYFTIIRTYGVQTDYNDILSQNSFNITLGWTPVAGELLVLAWGGYSVGSSAFDVSCQGITQTNVTWTRQATIKGSQTGATAEIWVGIVSAGAGTSVTLGTSNFGAYGGIITDICEYSGLAVSSFLDQTATYDSGSPATTTGDTGQTAATTQSSELWVGAIIGANSVSSAAQSAPTGGFTLLDGADKNLVGFMFSLGYLEKFVSSTGQAEAQDTFATPQYVNGCIATFFAQITTYTITASSDANSSISPLGAVVVNQGANQTFTYSANTGYNISQVLVDGSPVSITGSYTFINVQATHTIAISSTIQTFTITASSDANSTITPSGAVTVNYGGNQTFTYSANAGYVVSQVLVDGSSVAITGSYTFTNVQATHTIAVSSTKLSSGAADQRLGLNYSTPKGKNYKGNQPRSGIIEKKNA